jgi:hypothetical protein
MIGLLGPVAIAASLQAQGTFSFVESSAFALQGATGPSTSFAGTRGWGFSSFARTNNIAITQLGVYDHGGDGLANAHRIGLWLTNGTLLASSTVPAGTTGTLIDGYRYVPIDPVVLALKFPFSVIIAAQYTAGDVDDLVSPSPVWNWSVMYPMATLFPSYGWYGLGSDFPFPSQQTQPASEGTVGRGFWEVNFRYVVVPEPSSVALLSGGLLLFVALKRRFRCR